MKRKIFLILGVVMVGFFLLQAAAFAAGGGIVLKITKDSTLQKWDDKFMAPNAGTNLEFFAGSAPAPNTGSGSFTMDNVTDFGTKVQYDYSDVIGSKTPVINGKTITLRIWDGPMHKKGSHYGTAGYAASKDAPAMQYDVNPFKTTYYAWEPKNAPTVTGATESNQRIGETQNIVLKLSWSYTYNSSTSDGTIPKTGYTVKFWKEGESEPGDTADGQRVFDVTGDSFSLPDEDALNNNAPFGAGTYYFQVRAKNWFGPGPWSDPPFEWTTLSGAGGVAGPVTVTLNKKPDGHGINTVAFPFAPAEVNGVEIKTLQQLIEAINTHAGANVIRTLGYWDSDKQIGVGWTFEDDGKIKNHINTEGATPADTDLVANRSYNIYVAESVPALKFSPVGAAEEETPEEGAEQ
jgi:hypothetical protein